MKDRSNSAGDGRFEDDRLLQLPQLLNLKLDVRSNNLLHFLENISLKRQDVLQISLECLNQIHAVGHFAFVAVHRGDVGEVFDYFACELQDGDDASSDAERIHFAKVSGANGD